jgi:hypothetical protein
MIQIGAYDQRKDAEISSKQTLNHIAIAVNRVEAGFADRSGERGRFS